MYQFLSILSFRKYPVQPSTVSCTKIRLGVSLHLRLTFLLELCNWCSSRPLIFRVWDTVHAPVEVNPG
ncbi:hypothetical protein OUZ56_010359 [Daphnia magna]|uniref:Uncharacterized protein n=1 Tax=Daphnia magna TaxID=35525 RepID=A0ABR0AIF3_9CRUS|nr:hypothetical protein OUZ56_010359 [Daphnia magna]